MPDNNPTPDQQEAAVVIADNNTATPNPGSVSSQTGTSPEKPEIDNIKVGSATKLDHQITMRVNKDTYDRWAGNVASRIEIRKSGSAAHLLNQLMDFAKNTWTGGMTGIK